ncbi:PTS sugar transporter subunit IIA [Vibrio sp. TRT 21S02]|uniref:PTS sugar transporter subunit IIA n=1 Tax=Vibrio sp. TRT 21S02 TaxID=3418507 RepID=UPI003CF1E1A8
MSIQLVHVCANGKLMLLSQYITASNVKILESVADWKQAIDIVGQCLLEQRAIEKHYLDAIKTTADQLGPYFVLAPMIAMPHARPDDGVNHNSLSLLVVRDGVEFHSTENDPVKIILLLAAIDSNQHIELITSISEFFCCDKDVEAVSKAQNKEQILKILAKY